MRLLFSLFLAGLAIAAPSPRSTHVLHERRAALSPEWVQSRRLDSDLILPMKFGLTQQNMHRLEELLLEISHPESPKYSQHYTPEQVMETFAPSAESIAEVMNWLTDSGIARERIRLSGNKGWIHLNATVAEAEELLQTEYHVFSHSSGEETLGCHHYSVPAHVKEHIDIIRPTVHANQRLPSSHRLERRTGGLGKPSIFNGPKRASSQAVKITPNLENCDQFITPDCLRALYDIKHKPVATNKNSYGIVEFTPQAFLAGDLDLFFRNFSPSLVGVRPKAVLIDGAVVQTTNQSFDFNGESDLDLQYSMSLSAPQPITLLQTGDLVEGAGFDNWLDAVDASFCTFDGGDDPNQDGIYPDPLPGGFKGPESCGIIAPPRTVSVSFLQDEQTVTPAFANRQCNEYAKLGLMGTTVFHSSGDFGVAGNGGICLDANHNPVDPSVGPGGTVFNPGFPASCPFVTAVGATQINPGSTVNDPEGACEQVIFSGGGFSNIFPMPSYQANAVRSFLKNHPPPFTNGQFNNSGNARGFPDVAANGANYVIGIDGEFNLVFGTSASSPVVGSIITLVNDARIAIGKKPVGFLNPLLYSPLFRGAFNDITSGGNQGCGTPGFTATTGWDPVTGVGTPNLTKLIDLALVLP